MSDRTLFAETLEPRTMLAATVLRDFGGLPRETTQVGDVLYFALDSKPDGYLTYVDLVAYDVRRDKQWSIVKSNGKPFGQLRYFLSNVDGQLVIREQDKLKNYYWLINNGQTRATRIDGYNDARKQVSSTSPWSDPVEPAGVQFSGVRSQVRLGKYKVAFIANVSKSTARLYTMNNDGSGVTPFEFTKPADFAGFEAITALDKNRLLVSIKTTSNAARVYVTNGAGNGSLLLRGNAGSADAPEPVDISKVVWVNSGRALVLGKTSSGTQSAFLTTGSTETTKLQIEGRTFFAALNGTQYEIDDRVIFMPEARLPQFSDPEAVGGYVAPGGSKSGSITTIGGIQYVVSTYAVNFTTGEAIEVYNIENGDAVRAGDHIYVRERRDDKVSSLEITQLDGKRFGTQLATATSWGPMHSVADKLVFQPSSNSSVLMTARYDGPFPGAIRGTIAFDGSVADAMPVPASGVIVYLDQNRNKRQDSSERGTRSDGDGNFAFESLASGNYFVRIANTSKLSVLSDQRVAVSVNPQEVTTRNLVVHDVAKKAVLTVKVTGVNVVDGAAFAVPGAAVFIDYNLNGAADSDEPKKTTDARGYTRFSLVPKGNYRLGVVKPEDASYGYIDGAPGAHFFTAAIQSETPTLVVSPVNYAGSASLSVQFYIDSNLNGIKDASETEPASPGLGIKVYVDLNRNGVRDAGEYKIDSISYDAQVLAKLKRGSYLVRTEVDSSWGVRTATAPLEIELAGRNRKLAIGCLPPDNVVRGRMFVDSNFDGTWNANVDHPFFMHAFADLDGNGVMDSWDPRSEGIGNDGEFEIRSLPARSVRVHLQNYDLSALATPAATATAPTFSLQFAGTQSIRVGVFYDTNRNRIKDANESTRTIDELTLATQGFAYQSTVDADGIYHFNGLYLDGLSSLEVISDFYAEHNGPFGDGTLYLESIDMNAVNWLPR